MKRIVENKHPLAIRWFHWINFPVLAIMIWSGLLIYWAWHPYKIQIGSIVLIEFFPQWFFKALKLPRRLAEGMAWHFVFQWLFILNGILYVGYTTISGEWRYLLPKRSSLREGWQVILHDLGIRKAPLPVEKYNAAQRIAYSAIIVMGLGSLLTGLAIYKPTQVWWLTGMFGGYEMARLIHFALTIGYVLFFLVHIAQVIKAGWNNFRSMVTGFDVNPQVPHMPEREKLTTEQQIRRRTIKAFSLFGLASIVPVGVWKYINAQPRVAGIPGPLRSVLNVNEQIANTYFSNQHLAPTFPLGEAAKQPRVNGRDGLKGDFDPATWKLNVQQPGRPNLALSLDDVKSLPKHELVFDFKCVEGWSQIQHWGGARLSDFITRYGLGTRSGQPATSEDDFFKHVGMMTPDGGYYVGLDMASAMHPQTLLAYEMNGQPLTGPHGAPLRLIIPVKYGVKNLKRIGTITFADDRPRDFWGERGYDYHLGL